MPLNPVYVIVLVNKETTMKTMKNIKTTKSTKTNVQPLHHITVYRNKDNVITKYRVRVKASEAIDGKSVDVTIDAASHPCYQAAMLDAVRTRDSHLRTPINAF